MSARDVALLAAVAIFLLSFTGPGSPPDTSLQSKGSQALDRGDYQQAEQIFSQLVAADPKDYFAYFNLALAEVGLKKDDRAIADFKQTLALKPGIYQAQLNLGLVYLRDNQAGEAIPLLEAVVSAKPDDAKGHLYWPRPTRRTGSGRRPGRNSLRC